MNDRSLRNSLLILLIISKEKQHLFCAFLMKHLKNSKILPSAIRLLMNNCADVKKAAVVDQTQWLAIS